MSDVILKAPTASVIVSLPIPDRGVVKRGMIVAILDSSAYKAKLERLLTHQSKLTNHLNRLNDQTENDRRAAYLQALVDLDKDRSNKAATEAQTTFLLYTFGRKELDEAFRATNDSYDADCDLIIDQLNCEQLSVDIKHSVRAVETTIAILKREQDYVSHRIDQMSIKAPVDGKLLLHVGVDVPVRRGFVLGQIERT